MSRASDHWVLSSIDSTSAVLHPTNPLTHHGQAQNLRRCCCCFCDLACHGRSRLLARESVVFRHRISCRPFVQTCALVDFNHSPDVALHWHLSTACMCNRRYIKLIIVLRSPLFAHGAHDCLIQLQNSIHNGGSSQVVAFSMFRSNFVKLWHKLVVSRFARNKNLTPIKWHYNTGGCRRVACGISNNTRLFSCRHQCMSVMALCQWWRSVRTRKF